MSSLEERNSNAGLQKKSMIKAFMLEEAERLERVWWRSGLLSLGISKNEATKSKNDVIGVGRETSGRGIKVMKGLAETNSVEGLDITKVTETEGRCLSISLPNSNMEDKWPCDGYKTTVSSIMRRLLCVCSDYWKTDGGARDGGLSWWLGQIGRAHV